VRDGNARGASRMIELLGGVLREVLHAGATRDRPLADELRFAERYLEIEQVRFSDRLRVRWAVDPGVRDALVPEFLLQPLVENAVRHGIAPRREGGTIEIAARAEGDALVLEVRDDGAGYAPDARGPGLGLANVRERLATLFGDAARLAVARGTDGGTVAAVRLPLRRRGDG